MIRVKFKMIISGILLMLFNSGISKSFNVEFEFNYYGICDSIRNNPLKTLEVGDRIFIYSSEKVIDNSSFHHKGKVTKFIKGHKGSICAVVKLEESIQGDKVTGDIIVMELRNKGRNWNTIGPLYIKLCNFEPKESTWLNDDKGEWFERAFLFTIIK